MSRDEPIGVIFDNDGVLADTGPFHKRGWELFAEENGIRTSEAFFYEHFGMVNSQILPKFFGRALSDEEIRRYDARKEELYRATIRGALKPMPGLLDLVDRLAVAGVIMAVGSSGYGESVEMVISELGIGNRLATIVSSGDVVRGKPAPDIFLKAAAGMGVRPELCVVIEDASVGIQAAHAGGMACIALVGTYSADRLRDAELVVTNLGHVDVKTVARLARANAAAGGGAR